MDQMCQFVLLWSLQFHQFLSENSKKANLGGIIKMGPLLVCEGAPRAVSWLCETAPVFNQKSRKKVAKSQVDRPDALQFEPGARQQCRSKAAEMGGKT